MRIKVAKQVFSYLRSLLCCCKYDPELKDTAPRSSGDGENDHDILLNIVADDSSHVAWNPPNPVDEKLSRSVSNGHASGQNDVASVAPDTMESCTSSPGIEMKHKALPNPPVVVGQPTPPLVEGVKSTRARRETGGNNEAINDQNSSVREKPVVTPPEPDYEKPAAGQEMPDSPLDAQPTQLRDPIVRNDITNDKLALERESQDPPLDTRQGQGQPVHAPSQNLIVKSEARDLLSSMDRHRGTGPPDRRSQEMIRLPLEETLPDVNKANNSQPPPALPKKLPRKKVEKAELRVHQAPPPVSGKLPRMKKATVEELSPSRVCTEKLPRASGSVGVRAG